RASNERGHADDEKPAQIFVAHLRYPPKPFLAAARMLQWREAQPGGELSSGAELVRISDGSGERRGTDGAHSRDRCKPQSDVARAVPGEQLAFDLPQPRLKIEYLLGQTGDHLCSQRRYVGHFARHNTLSETQRVRDPTPYLNAKLRE